MPDSFEIKATDLAARIGSLKTKTSEIETPALLPVIHPVKQLVPCKEIRQMGYDAVMTNAYTTYRRLRDRADEGIHRIIDYDGTIMTDSGGYQVLEFGGVDITPAQMAAFEEKIGSDVAIILDKPTGLDVTRKHAVQTVEETLRAAELTKTLLTRSDMLWTLPIQGGKYLDLVSRSAKASARLDYDCYALGSPVEVMEEYDFSLLVRMVLTSKRHLPTNRPFHLFGAGHPLILPLAVALGCDMFDSASYMLYAKQDRYISSSGTIRLAQLEYLGCTCKVCSRLKARELKQLKGEERVIALARHNLAMLKQMMEETKQAIWEGRLWEYVQANSRNHPKALEAFRVAASESGEEFELGTPGFKDRGIFISEPLDLSRPEVKRHVERIRSIDLSERRHLVILPETKTKPFLRSEIYQEVAKIVRNRKDALVTFICPNFGLVPAEISDIYPLSQATNAYSNLPDEDPILGAKKWGKIDVLITRKERGDENWLSELLSRYFKVGKLNLAKKNPIKPGGNPRTELNVFRSYKSLKKSLSSVD